jgi:tRNA (guanine-N7-)-methyltransferase
MAQENPAKLFLGLEIRKQIIACCIERKNKRNLTNLNFLHSNANVDLSRLLQDIINYESIEIEMISIQFPDPYFKNKQIKRRLVNSDLVRTIARFTSTNTKIFLQTDVLDVMNDMTSHFCENGCFDIAVGYEMTKMENNLACVSVHTEREIATQVRFLYS